MTRAEVAQQIVDSAARCAGENPSALIALSDARDLLAEGDDVSAVRRALKSLMYSVGVGAQAHREACLAWLQVREPELQS